MNKNQNQQMSFKKAFINSTKSFLSIMPMMIAIVGIVGIFQSYVTPKFISSLFGLSYTIVINIYIIIFAIIQGKIIDRFYKL
jgi:uncharacterized membrane protein YraQ (UPF0718 family)